MRKGLIIILFMTSHLAGAQHCPWDCSGMILLKTDATSGEMSRLNPVLVDGDRKLVIDTLYGTGLNSTADTCQFLVYEDFLKFRVAKTAIHYWYSYDTVYHFAKDHYLVKYNYCKYNRNNESLYIRINDLNNTPSGYRYIEVTAEKGIHLHNYHRLLNDRKTGELLTALAPMVIFISRVDLGLN